MNDRENAELADQQEIDRVADQFERDWRQGKKPEIKKYLDRHQHIVHPLQEELLRIEREMLQRDGKNVTRDDFCCPLPADQPADDATLREDSDRDVDDELVAEFERLWNESAFISAEAFAKLRCRFPSQTIFRKLLERETELRSKRFQDSLGDVESDFSVGSSSESGEPLPSTFGRYRVTRLISRGGFGEVYSALDPKLDREVAIKTPRGDRVLDETAREDFEREAKLICRLEHPHILPVYDYGMADSGRPYLVCKLVDAETLSHRLASTGMNFHEVVRISSAVAQALGHAHSNGVVHRDVKPGNILLSESGHAWLTDFGLGLESPKTHLRLDRSGTPKYWSPEQAQGKAHLVDGRSDLFSLGIVIYVMLTGTYPFDADTDAGILKRIIEADVKPPRQCNGRIPKTLEDLCLQALRREPTERFSTAEDLVEALEEVGTYDPQPIDTTGIQISEEVRSLIERLAINVHDIWARKRIEEGWIVGPSRNDTKKTHPDLVPFEQLSKGEQDYDREVVDSVLRAATALGVEIKVPGPIGMGET